METGTSNGWRRVSRRIFLRGVAAATFFVGFRRWVWAFVVESFPVRSVEKNSFLFDVKTGLLRWDDRIRKWRYRLTVDGLVENPLRLSYADLRDLPQVAQTSDLHCVEGWSEYDIPWSGFRFEELTNRARPKAEATYVVFHALGETTGQPKGQTNYIESHSLESLLDPEQEALMVLDLDGKPLPFDHGSPLRLITPYKLGYKNIKHVTRVEFTDEPRPGWWSLASPIYPVDAPVPERRLRRKGDQRGGNLVPGRAEPAD